MTAGASLSCLFRCSRTFGAGKLPRPSGHVLLSPGSPSHSHKGARSPPASRQRPGGERTRGEGRRARTGCLRTPSGAEPSPSRGRLAGRPPVAWPPPQLGSGVLQLRVSSHRKETQDATSQVAFCFVPWCSSRHRATGWGLCPDGKGSPHLVRRTATTRDVDNVTRHTIARPSGRRPRARQGQVPEGGRSTSSCRKARVRSGHVLGRHRGDPTPCAAAASDCDLHAPPCVAPPQARPPRGPSGKSPATPLAATPEALTAGCFPGSPRYLLLGMGSP